ncbi:large ribosomal subunit protein mL53 [Petaurus breviceps papuanus]|uniref:large ribosomal subunit protein mL53 n=1 Tax=Petaurus breviceps papuanus TaxID=3040969 RepID=UPI0036DA1F12
MQAGRAPEHFQSVLGGGGGALGRPLQASLSALDSYGAYGRARVRGGVASVGPAFLRVLRVDYMSQHAAATAVLQAAMAGAVSNKLGLQAVKRVLVRFCPFESNVEATRKFLQSVSSEKVRASNLNCTVQVDVRHDGSEPCVDVLFGDGDRLILRGAHLTAREMLAALDSRVRAKNRTSSGGQG